MLDLNVEWVEVMMLRKREAQLRKKEKMLSVQLEKLGEAFSDALQRRKIVSQRANDLEKKLFEEQGKVKFFKKRKSSSVKSVSEKKMSITERAVRLATEGRLEEALELMRKRG